MRFLKGKISERIQQRPPDPILSHFTLAFQPDGRPPTLPKTTPKNQNKLDLNYFSNFDRLNHPPFTTLSLSPCGRGWG